ncbi:MAG: acylphosphatase [Actinobacteria bacterium]|nr:acylphosphatase [Actinomycetota bacterium]
MAKTRAHVFIDGKVQGVYFRSYLCEKAGESNVTGWVKNLADGRVEAVLEGEEENIVKMIGFCKEGPPSAKIIDLKVDWFGYTGEFSSFSIKYY